MIKNIWDNIVLFGSVTVKLSSTARSQYLILSTSDRPTSVGNVKANTAPGGPDTQAAAGGLIRSSTAALALVTWSTVGVLLSVGKLVL